MANESDKNSVEEVTPDARPDGLEQAAESGADDESPAATPDPEPAIEAFEQTFSESEPEKSELEVARERAIRLQAELENFRKRTHRTMEEERRYAGLPLMRDLLAVVDNLQRAIEAAEQSDHAAGLLQGVKMVAEQLTSVLAKHHCQPIEAEGAPFDPNRHEAIAQFPSDEHEPGMVTQVTQTGYELHGRVVRPSQVIVAAPRPADENDGSDDPSAGENDDNDSA
jgi:molecular chaperone GrpE